ncbi:MAG: GNAT family N-acetyltransferase [Wenzhouxiangellaceae bacterium]
MPSDTSINLDPATAPIGAVDEAEWNALNRDGNPFTDHRFLTALEQSGCVGGQTGWQSIPIALDPESGPYTPAWLKFHSHGEFVFDFAWAEAAHRVGLRWYPKLLVAAPLTPVTGPRLLGRDLDQRTRLLQRLEAVVEANELSSCSINFCDVKDREALDRSQWLRRFDWQFHWHNRDYRSFDDFLTALRSKPRKNVRRERRLARADGWHYRWIDGENILGSEIDTVAECYRTTFALYGNLPSLNRPFFEQAAGTFGRQFLVCMASQHGRDLACSVFWKSESRLYGRYWGSLVETRDVHFEACYYQGIEYCIEHGLDVFEPGAQGEHKIRRGFTPVKTYSYHHIQHPAMREGIRRWLEMEARALKQYRVELQSLEPYH